MRRRHIHGSHTVNSAHVRTLIRTTTCHCHRSIRAVKVSEPLGAKNRGTKAGRHTQQAVLSTADGSEEFLQQLFRLIYKKQSLLSLSVKSDPTPQKNLALTRVRTTPSETILHLGI